VRLLGLDFASLDVAAAAEAIAARSDDAPFSYVVTPNADHLVRLSRRPALHAAYAGAWLRLMDSRVVARAARLIGLGRFVVCPGSDLVAALVARGAGPVTIIGGASSRIHALIAAHGIDCRGHYNPPMGFEDDPAAFANAVRFAVAHPARLILLAVGSPRQERLAEAIAATGEAHGTALCIGAGLDFLSGAARRAPGWMQRAGLEWLHRLLSDPRRLAGRYLRDSPRVFVLLLRARFGRVALAARAGEQLVAQSANHAAALRAIGAVEVSTGGER
jgi:N-acetylglucosaminyldiphosphoundecaprenol N-acetyl-beta-D-mannosaminyltransferase